MHNIKKISSGVYRYTILNETLIFSLNMRVESDLTMEVNKVCSRYIPSIFPRTEGWKKEKVENAEIAFLWSIGEKTQNKKWRVSIKLGNFTRRKRKKINKKFILCYRKPLIFKFLNYYSTHFIFFSDTPYALSSEIQKRQRNDRGFSSFLIF